jgi:hypothetical protein
MHMSKELKPSGAIGLDVGTSRIVCARQGPGDQFHYESQLNAFVSVPNTKMRQKALRNENIRFTEEGDHIRVSGNHAPHFADLLNLETRRPMSAGVLNAAEADSLAVLEQVVSLLTEGAAKPGAKVCFSVPATPLRNASDENHTYHQASLRQMFERMGYDPQPVNEGLAVIYSELEESNYTGIGVSLGGGLCNVALAYLSMPAIAFSIPKAGDFIDTGAAAVTGDLAIRVRLAKEQSFHLNGSLPDKLHQVLTVYYDDMIASLLAAMQESFATSRRLPRFGKAVPLVLSGGTALPAGFRDRFAKALHAADLPVAVSEIRLARDPLNTTARGALAAALTEM